MIGLSYAALGALLVFCSILSDRDYRREVAMTNEHKCVFLYPIKKSRS